MRGLRQSTRKSYSTHTPNTVMPVSLTSMAQVPSNRLASKQPADTVEGRESSEACTPTLLKQRER